MIGRLLSFVFVAGVFASLNVHSDEGSDALERYYAELESALSRYNQYDIPFAFESIDVVGDDTLMKISRELKFDELDTLHMAAAILVNNSGAFKGNNPSKLVEGKTLKMPSVGELYLARYTYERVYIDGYKIGFDGDINVMRDGIRFPFHISNRENGVSVDKSSVAAEDLSGLSERQLEEVSVRNNKFVEPVSSRPQNTAEVVWDVRLWGARGASSQHVEKLSELVREKTSGRFLLDISYGDFEQVRGNLGGIASGSFEMAQYCVGQQEEQTPSISVLELPYLGIKDLDQDRWVSQWLYRHPSVRADFARYNAVALMPSPLPPYNAVGVGSPPGSLNDLEGIRVGTIGDMSEAVKAFGGEPVSLTVTNAASALTEGLVDAVVFAPNDHMRFNTLAVGTWWTTNLDLGRVHCPVVASIGSVNELSDEFRTALYESINPALDFHISSYKYNLDGPWLSALENARVKKVTFNPGIVESFSERVLYETSVSWIEGANERELPGAQIYNLVTTAKTGKNPEVIERLTDLTLLLKDDDSPAIQSELWFYPDEAKLAVKKDFAAFKKVEMARNRPEKERIARERAAADASRKQAAEAARLAKELSDAEAVRLANSLPVAETFPIQGQVNSGAEGASRELQLNGTSLSDFDPESYLGAPRNSDPVVLSNDPLSYPVEWEVSKGVQVATVMLELADYIGYSIEIVDSSVRSSYERSMPGIQRKVSGVSVGEAFELLGGQGFLTTVNHVKMTVKHIPRQQSVAITDDIVKCPGDMRTAVEVADGVYRLSNGSQCVL